MAKSADAVAAFRVGGRCQVDGFEGPKGWVRYAGPVTSGGKERHFVGVEWDDPGRGKNDGSVDGVLLFRCEPGMGSFVHPKRVTRGCSVRGAVDDKYRADFDAADRERTLIAQNGEGGKTFEVPVVFVGQKEAHDRLRDVGQLTQVVLNDAAVEALCPGGDADGREAAARELGAMLPTCTEVDLSNNLLTSWDDVAALAGALPLAELRLSKNCMAPPPSVPLPVLADGRFRRLARLFLNSVPRAWQHAVALDAAGCLPALEELHLCVNGIETLGEGDALVAGFQRLEFLNLTGNAIAEWGEVERLRRLPRLRRLMLNGNKLREVRYPRDDPAGAGSATPAFAVLEWLSLRDNEIVGWESVDRMNDFPALIEIGFLRNPLAATRSDRDMRIEVLARVATLRVMNHSEVTKRERADAEKMYLKRCALEAHQAGKRSPPPERHPRFAELVETYGYPAGVKDDEKSKANLSGRLLTLRIRDADKDVTKEKKVPKTLTVGQLKALLVRLFRVPAVKQNLFLDAEAGGPEVPLDDNIKQLSFYDVAENALIVLRR